MASPARRGVGLGLGSLVLAAAVVGVAGSGLAIDALRGTPEPPAGSIPAPAPPGSANAEVPRLSPRAMAPFPRYSPLPTPGPVPDLATPTPAPPSFAHDRPVAAGPTRRVATRVAIPDLGVDLPVTRQRTSYPPCDVAMYLREFRQPGQGGPVYLYAHAQRGMFLPLLERSRRRDGASMLGMRAYVWTGDNQRFEYEIYRVRRHARNFRPVVRARGETLWLQTSEGPNASYPKLQVAARLVGSVAVDHAEAHPKPRPVSC